MWFNTLSQLNLSPTVYLSVLIGFRFQQYGHFAHDCLKAHDNANISQESEQNGKVENMLDLDSTSVCKECVMMCTELQYEHTDKDLVVYGDQGNNTEEYEKATYGDLPKT